MTTFDDPLRAPPDALVEELVERLAARVAVAGARARALGRPVLASVVAPAPPVDPLDALERAAAADDPAVAAQAAAGRVYWTRPSDAFAFAGVGAVATLTGAGPERFAAVERAWAALLDGAAVDDLSVDDLSDGAAGAGPLLAGGFAFDPAGPRGARWRGFPGARLVLPRVQLARSGGGHWITANALVGPDGRPDVDLALLAALAGVMCAAPDGDLPHEGLLAGVGRTGSATGAGLPRVLALGDDRPAAEWRALVADGVAAIRAGVLEKVVLARAVRAAAPAEYDVGAALRALRAAYPDCYVFGVWGDDDQSDGGAAFVGASPERLVRLDGRAVRATSLAGSAPRGGAGSADDPSAAALLASAKDRAEHAIVRGWLVGALGELCDDVRAAPEPSLRVLANVYHLHTDVTARLRPGRSIFDLLARLHPTPAVGGAPRGAALLFIAEREELDRGWYAAPVGWAGRGGGEFAVALRSALVRGREAWLYAGCGVVADSDPAREYDESRAKLRAMEQALAAASAVSPAVAAG